LNSNAKDPYGFAGAGLHDSVPISKSVERDIDYAEEQWMNVKTVRSTPI